ncbi:unnamed protein product [Arctia plantaginis]|uniref:MoaB/Mog domain-containing protein n=1 Tax=Arctia plantaginis TaxID=874455 RepID=A0A8S1AMB5_ARCPL|nr:unnamed protein product [Arctia plantaginis]
MPRALSLKKPQQAVPAKNQKSITAFFKNTGDAISQDLGSSDKNLHKQTCTEINKSKRKAMSPVKCQMANSVSMNDRCKDSIASGSQGNLPKKIKTERNTKVSSPNKTKISSPNKKSPNKENTLNAWLSPKKQLLADLDTQYGPHKKTKQLNNDTTDEKRDSQVKLMKTDLKNDYMILNKVDINQELNIFENELELENNDIKTTPTKSSNKMNAVHSLSRKSRTPKKSPLQEFKCSPICQLTTPNKLLTSPSKSGSTVTMLNLSTNEIDEFNDEFNVDDIEEDTIEDLDLSIMQRCEILSAIKESSTFKLRLKNGDKKATCLVEGIWLDTPLLPGEIVSVIASRNAAGQYCVNNTSGLLVLRPDHLMSSTSVVAGVFCKRKAVLQEHWRGIDSANIAMTTGILIHELVQTALTQNITSIDQLKIVTDNIITESIERLYDAGVTEDEARISIHNYLPPLADFMNTYVAAKPPTVTHMQKDKNNWQGHIDKVLDIEENLCCPKLGLKGKIDATLQVTIHERKGRQRVVVPMELKSGKASMSAEHRGQLVLYGMMLNLQNGEDPTQAAQRGLLLYLKDRVELREVSCGYPERRDLIMLRNQLVQYLSASPQDIDQEQLTDIEDAAMTLQQKLPEPVDHHNACAKCPYLTLCSLHLWHTDGPSVSESHPLSKLRTEALGHLSQEHIKYFLHWNALIKMEEKVQLTSSPIHSLWTDSIEKREKRGTCAAKLKLKAVQASGDKFLHNFQRQDTDDGASEKAIKGPQEGEFSIVSIDDRPWIAAGVVIVSNSKEIQIVVERDLSQRLDKNTTYHIDTYESYATTGQNLTNLGVLMEETERAERLRKLIIDKECPEFNNKLPREVGRLGTKLMRTLNIQQQRAVLKALAAKDYALLQGLPGTGKTQTISVLIQMLVSLKQRVLVTAHTHSAVDTVLTRIPESVRVLRLGSSSRVAPALHKRTEQALTVDCRTPEQLAQMYDSMEVVGVTCLGAAHAMLARTTFDICIVDEATQVLQSTVLRPLYAAKRFVLVGDPDQLPPVVRSRAARRLGMEESLFHRLMCEGATSTLQLQYRMNQAIVDIANHVAYDGKLKCANQNIAQARLDIDLQKIFNLQSDAPWLARACSPELEHAVLFMDVDTYEDVIDTPKNKYSCTNSTEACIVLALVEVLKQGNVKSSDIGVIAPYRDQVSLLRRLLTRHAVEVSTVDQFQGRDKSVIIYSCTKRAGRPDVDKVKDGEVLNDQRRLAVSVTRAKHKLLIVGNSIALQRYAPFQRVLTTCHKIKLDKNAERKIKSSSTEIEGSYNKMVKAVAIITISDTCFKDNSKDTSGPALAELAKDLFPEANLHTIIIPDEKEIIERELKYFCESNLDLVLTTGGTGLTPRDVTPEATKAVVQKEIPGIITAITVVSLEKTPMAQLSRAVAGVRDKTLIVNFPGSKKAVIECFEVVKPILPHAIAMIRDESEQVSYIHKSMQCSHTCMHSSKVDVSKVALRPRESPFPLFEMVEAWNIVDNAMSGWKERVEVIAIEEALGRVVAQQLCAKEPMPPFPASVKDGYACLSIDGVGVRKVRTAVTAGDAPTAPLSSGECARVNTGAALPAGADCVVQVEDTRLVSASEDGQTEIEVEILKAPEPQQDVRCVGFDIAMGAVLVDKGFILDPPKIALLAGAGHLSVTVRVPPKVALLSTGNELQEPSEVKLQPSHIRDSNRTMLRVLLREHGYDSIDCGIARDSPPELVAAISAAFKLADVLVCSGGVSMGEKDLLKPVLLKDFGATLHFGRVRMKPGKPSTFATCEFEGKTKYIFALPGNPVSAYVCSLLFVIRALRVSCGLRGAWPRLRVRLAHAVKLDLRPEYARAALDLTAEGDMPTATLLGNQCSSRLQSACGASALLELPGAGAALRTLPAGAVVTALVTGRLH